jgi:hypothetical protein
MKDWAVKAANFPILIIYLSLTNSFLGSDANSLVFPPSRRRNPQLQKPSWHTSCNTLMTTRSQEAIPVSWSELVAGVLVSPLTD